MNTSEYLNEAHLDSAESEESEEIKTLKATIVHLRDWGFNTLSLRVVEELEELQNK
jgi:hypothetical protein